MECREFLNMLLQFAQMLKACIVRTILHPVHNLRDAVD